MQRRFPRKNTPKFGSLKMTEKFTGTKPGQSISWNRKHEKFPLLST